MDELRRGLELYDPEEKGKSKEVGIEMLVGAIRDFEAKDDKPAVLRGQLRRLEMASRSSPELFGRLSGGRGRYVDSYPNRWFDQLFPNLANQTRPVAARPSTWPAEARELARLVHHRDRLAKLSGLSVERRTETFHRDGTPIERVSTQELYSPTGWAVRTVSDQLQTVIEWCDGTERRAVQTGFRHGRVRAAVPGDLRDAPMFFFTDPLDEAYAGLSATIRVGDGPAAILVLRNEPVGYEIRSTIDREKRVLLKVEHLQGGKSDSTTTYPEFVRVGETWWPQRTETTGPDGKRKGVVIQTVAILPADDFAAQVKELQSVRGSAFVLRSPAPKVADAKKALAAGTATADDRFALIDHYAGYQ